MAAGLAHSHAKLARRASRSNDLLRKLAINRRQLIATYRATLSAVTHDRWISPAGEWLIDNFHVITEQLREAQKSLPRRFYRELPQLDSSAERGLPRAFAIAAELVRYTDGRLDIALLERFLGAYQAVTPLNIGELWAIPIALRHAFLDRLARIAARVDEARREREAAHALAQQLARTAARGAEEVAATLRRRVAGRVLPSTTMFVTELAQQLRDQDPALALAGEWLEQRIHEGGTTLEEAIRAEHRSQAANQTSVGNVIGSMRTITATDWSKIFEALSHVERILRQDPHGAYAKMEFATRDRYRHVVERLSRRSGRSEIAVAEGVLALALGAPAAGDPRARHVGYYLVDHGVVALGNELGYRPLLRERVARLLRELRTVLYLGSIALLTVALSGLLSVVVLRLGASIVAATVLGVLAALPMSELALSLVNLTATVFRAPVPLPKLDFSLGVPPSAQTLVVVPVMLTSRHAIDQLLETLEIRYLANQDPALHFALCTDFLDASSEAADDDATLLTAVSEGISGLNAVYASAPFLLLHRHRVWSETEQRFMGWERKRGKIAELNRLLLGDETTSFSTIVGALSSLRATRYIITLDSDTQLPPGTAARLIGAMAHPLNQPQLDERTGMVIGGHAVLQPRVSVAPTSARRSAFSRIFSDQEGIDPYTSAVSDVYQDLFDEGSFVGKGIYDLRVFERALAGRVPESAVLSHDLLEGLFARAGFLSDVELFDETPSTYAAHSLRRHRWIRGDWQIEPWLWQMVPSERGARVRSSLSLLSRSKIADNLRRSLVAPATLALLLVGWVISKAPLYFTAIGFVVLGLPLFARGVTAILRLPLDKSWRSGLHRVISDSARGTVRSVLTLLFLPHEAWSSCDAIIRARYRMGTSHRSLLEWMPAALAERSSAAQLAPMLRAMLPALAPVLLALTTAGVVNGWHVAGLLPIVGAWLLAPYVAVAISRATKRTTRPLSTVGRHFLRRTARKTWTYFDELITEADHYLPIDNYQENPAPLIAHRTSPTNLGLALLANVSALELGYISLPSCLARIERTLETMEQLERYRGHFLNWYDTITLAPLAPKYVSMVDSGNLAGMLIALKQFFLGAQDRMPSRARITDGLVDTLRLVEEQAEPLKDRALSAQIADLEVLLGAPPTSTPEEWLGRMRIHATKLLDIVMTATASARDSRSKGLLRWTKALVAQIEDHEAHSAAESTAVAEHRLHELAARADVLMTAMDFRFLFHEERQVFAIGYDVSADRRDGSFYDLLASEARVGSFVAIAQGQVPVSHWYKLGRPLAQVGRRRALLSWTGTMFEYLMPSLLMGSYPNTLLDDTCNAVVARQIAYGREARVPWGISEAAYNARDLHLNYQYGPFGVPGLGIKRGLADDLVVAPYATALALTVDPAAAVENLWRLAADGMDGDYGFYESIDYTPARVPTGERSAIVYAFMAHHQGMTLVSIAEHLHARPISTLFHTDPRVKAAELLLQERIPYGIALEERHGEGLERARPARTVIHEEWRDLDADAEPDVQLLSNGSYSVMLSSAGGGYSRWRGQSITRWREDPTSDPWGQFLYVRDIQRASNSSPMYQPLLGDPDSHELCFSLDKAEYRRIGDGIESHLVISVSTEDDAEVRVLTLTNQGTTTRELEVTSYAEVVLTTPATDAAHPAFAKLFVETELLPEHDALLATRRPRTHGEARAYAIHVCAVVGEIIGAPQHETDRARFIGRGRSTRDPAALEQALSGSVGPVLDPIFSLRRRVRIAPGKSARLLFTTAVADEREAALALAAKYAAVDAADRASALAWTQAQSQLHYLDVGLEQTRLYRRLAARLLYANRVMRAKDEVIARNLRGQSGLWGYGISGDLPILLLRVRGEEHLELIRDVLHAHEFWRMRGLSVELVILNEHPPSYLQSFQDLLLALLRSGPSGSFVDKPGGVFLRRADVMPPEDQTLLAAAARVVLVGSRGKLAEQMSRIRPGVQLPLPQVPQRAAQAAAELDPAEPLRLWNGTGGFSTDGKEYVIRMPRGTWTPAPWVNVLANASFGSLVSESGSGYEWAENCHENRLTEWSNDPVCDPSTSAIYLRDDETGGVWTPTPLPIRGDASFVVRHGQGYSSFLTSVAGIQSELTIFVAACDPVRLSRLTLRNRGRSARRLTITAYVEWTLGVTREGAARHVVTSIDEATGAFLAQNTYPGDLGSRIAFVHTVPAFTAHTGDRTELLGRNGDPRRPAALDRVGLSGRVGAGYDPCAALQLRVTLAAGEETTIVVVMGQAMELTQARALVSRYREAGAAPRELAAVRTRWNEVLDAIKIETPDEGLDLLVNRWLLYQTISSRLWGRTGFYQSGGAYGFRDQLQDVAALVYAQPLLAREHLVRAASRQFVEGDVQHWWHPPLGRGVRTRIADDYLWLPLIAAHYDAITADHGVWDEEVGFIETRALAPDEAEAYIMPASSDERASLYEHCIRALDRSLLVGVHGLPLMGCGDWNDGMNEVGVGGKGESVWMAWFLITVLERLAPVCELRGDAARGERYRTHATGLKRSIEREAWDGDWYLRAFFDDGTPLGSAKSDECRIDSLAQSWSVISGAAPAERALRAVVSAETHLCDRQTNLVKLLTPPFDKTAHDPGYIKGYVPGVRENGGQYTHAAAWLVLAETLLGRGDRAGELLRMINPAHLSSTQEGAARYRIEPYVMAGDVASITPHVGRGGWSWYTGAASWMYRVALESLLGFVLKGDQLSIAPCIPRAWPGFTIFYKRGSASYRIVVENPASVERGVAAVYLDGAAIDRAALTLLDDGAEHAVRVVMGEPGPCIS